MLKELDEACAAFDATDVDYDGFKHADFIFDGDIAKWKKFGYSLMLRLAMRVSNVDAGNGQYLCYKSCCRRNNGKQ